MKSEKSRKSWFRQLMNGQVRVGENYGQEEEIGMAAESSVEYGKGE